MEDDKKDAANTGVSAFKAVKERFSGKYYRVDYSPRHAKCVYVHEVCSDTVLPDKFMYDGIELTLEWSEERRMVSAIIRTGRDFIMGENGLQGFGKGCEVREIKETEFRALYRNALHLVSHRDETINASVDGSVKVVTRFLKDHGYGPLANDLLDGIREIKSTL